MKPRTQTALVAGAIFVGLLCGGVLNDRVTDVPLSNPLALLAFRYPALSGQDGLLASIGLAGVPFAAALAAVALLLCAWKLPGPWRSTPILCGATLFILWCGISTVAGGSFFPGLTMLTALAAALMIGTTTAILSERPDSRSTILYTLIGSGALISAIGIGEYIGSAKQHNYSWRVFSTFTDPNFLAGFLVMTTLPAVAVFLTARTRLLAVLAGLGMGIQAACLLLTGSRFGLLSLLVGLAMFAVLVSRGGLNPASKGRAKVLLAVGAAAILIGAYPVLRRLSKVGSESYSNQFRLYTWKAAGALAAAKPVLGSGFGTFDVASPPYSQVSYTQHAHNTFLQVAGETGIPGVLLLLIVLAAILARITHPLSRQTLARMLSGEDSADESISEPVHDEARRGKKLKARKELPVKSPSAEALIRAVRPETALDRRVILAGVAAGIAAAIVRNLFDSDLYVPANAMAFSCLGGLALGMTAARRDSQAETYALANGIGESPLPLPVPVRRTILVVIAVLTVARSAAVIVGRNDFLTADVIASTGHYAEAVDSYRAAAAMDIGNPDTALRSAPLLDGMGHIAEAEHAYQAAARLTKSAVPQYRYGRFLQKHGRTQDAIAAFEASRARNPNNLPSLMALAELYAKTGRQPEVEAIYRKMIALHQSPFGQIRATPEIVEWRFGVAYAWLAQIRSAAGSLEEADRLLSDANAIFAEYWSRRESSIFSPEYRPEIIKEVGGQYMIAIDRHAALFRQLHRPEDAAKQDKLLAEVKAQFEALQSAAPAS